MSRHDINPTELLAAHSIKMKETLADLIPHDQVLYDFGHAVAIPRNHYQVGLDSDTLMMKTRFDKQAALGRFEVDDMSEVEDQPGLELGQVEQFSNEIHDVCGRLESLMEKRERYLTVSGQRPIDNPINWDGWPSYPPPQQKGWHYEEEYGETNYYYDEAATPHYFGESFCMDDYRRTILDPYLKHHPNGGHLIRDDCGSWCVEGHEPIDVPSFQDFVEDLIMIINTSSDSIAQMLSTKRLHYLRDKFESYALLNERKEIYITKINPHRDFYNARKIDNNVDSTMAMSKKHLLNVINNKLNEEPDRVVYVEGEREYSLQQLFEPYFADDKTKRLNIDDLFEFGLIDHTSDEGVVDDRTTSYDDIVKREVLVRIDRTFLSVDNHIHGEYLGIMMKQLMSDYEKSKYQLGEIGLTLKLNSAHSIGSWPSICRWIVENKLVSYNVRWLVRIPRNYTSLFRCGDVQNFQEFLDKIFKPLFDASVDPLSDVNLHFFLTQTSALSLLADSHLSGDDSILDFTDLPPPNEWNVEKNPPYGYYLYYIFRNLTNLNKFRASKNLTLLTLRPLAAALTETHALDSLASSFLFADTVINAEKLKHHPVLQYLYYLKQVGISTSPLCWNKSKQFTNDDGRLTGRAVTYESHPIIDFFKCGMRVSLSTDKPLFSSLTREPLIEEYSIAGSIHKLSSIDLCELCRNSVLISGFDANLKRHWIGIKYVSGEYETEKCDDYGIQRCNVPDMRLDYRRDSVTVETQFVLGLASDAQK